jgi:hypothetical protein
MAANPSQIVFIIMAVLIVLDLVLLGAATIHFKQTRLILG